MPRVAREQSYGPVSSALAVRVRTRVRGASFVEGVKDAMRWKDLKTILRGRVPGQVIVQLTDKCNAHCPQCEMRVTSKFERKTLPTAAIERSIDAAAEKGFAAISFTGGEPLLMMDELESFLHRAGERGIPFIRTGTNGYPFARPESKTWRDKVPALVDRIAATPVRNFWISIDSAEPAVHERMRGFNELITGIEKVLPLFHERGLWPSANLGLNRLVGGDRTWTLEHGDGESRGSYLDRFYEAYRSSLEDFYRLVIDMGFTIVNCCYPMSIEAENPDELQAVYGATSIDRITNYDRDERAALFRAVRDAAAQFRSRIRIFSPLTSLYALELEYSGVESAEPYGCRGGIDFFFIDSRDGDTFPCGFRGGESMGRFWDLDMAQTKAPPSCTSCDWECFRDPSELFGPLLEGLRHPLRVARKMRRDATYRKLWVGDLEYYRACDYCDGREAPDFARLRPFALAETVPFPQEETFRRAALAGASEGSTPSREAV